MYEYLQGRVVARHPARMVLDLGGVGYDVAIPVGADFRSDGDDKVRVWTHFAVREDAHQLYGFPDPAQRQVFRMLLSVRGIGPALALGILSSLRGEALLDAVASENLIALTSVKGVGKKTAEQILLDLRDKTPHLQEAVGADASIVPHAPGRPRALADAVQALVSIGYSDKQAQKSVERAAREVDPEDLELLVRTALQD